MTYRPLTCTRGMKENIHSVDLNIHGMKENIHGIDPNIRINELTNTKFLTQHKENTLASWLK